MKAECVLESINIIARNCPEIAGDPEYGFLVQSLREEIGRDEAKKAGRADRFKAALRFSKFVNRENESRPSFAGAYNENGRQYIVHGHLAVRFDKPFDGLVMAEGNDRSNMDKILDAYDRSRPVELPGLAELKAKIKTDKAECKLHKDRWSITAIGGVYYNTDYLARMAEMVGPCEAYFSSSSRLPALVMVGEGAQGVVCPVNKKA